MQYFESKTANDILELYKSKSRKYDNPRDLIDYQSHSVSKLTNCPRKVVWQAETEMSDSLAEVLMRGTNIHGAFESTQKKTEQYMNYDEVHAKIDMIINNVPIEGYTTNMYKDFTPESYPLKVSQLMTYIHMAAQLNYGLEKNKGEILIYHLSKRIKRLQSYVVEFTDDEIMRNWRTIKRHQVMLQDYAKTGKIPEMDFTETDSFLECKFCEFYKRCYDDDIIDEVEENE